MKNLIPFIITFGISINYSNAQTAEELINIDSNTDGTIQLVIKVRNERNETYHTISGIDYLETYVGINSDSTIYPHEFVEIFKKNFKGGFQLTNSKALERIRPMSYSTQTMNNFEENEFKSFAKAFLEQMHLAKDFDRLINILRDNTDSLDYLMDLYGGDLPPRVSPYFRSDDIDTYKLIWYLWDKGIYVLKTGSSETFYTLHNLDLFREKFGGDFFNKEE